MKTFCSFLGKFLKEWSALKHTLGRLDSALAVPIVASMEKREEKLFASGLFLAAVLVDAQYRLLLSDESATEAKECLKSVVRRTQLKAKDNDTPEPPAELVENAVEEDDEFEKELDKIERRRALSATEVIIFSEL